MAAALPRPGVEIIQVFRSVTPTVITPTLVPCVVGVCRQVVEALVPTASGGTSLNSDALVPLQASALSLEGSGSPAVYAGLDGLSLVVSLNNSPDVDIEFTGSPLSPAQVVATVNDALGDVGVTSFIAEVVGSAWRLRSIAANEFQTIQVRGTSDAAVLTAFGFGAERVYSGASFYAQRRVRIDAAMFPDPRRNLDQLVIEEDSVRVFLYLGSGVFLQEALRTESFLRGDLAAPAVRTGSVDLTTLTYGGGGTLNGKTLIFTIDDATTPLTVTFGTPASVTAAIGEINAVIGAVATASINGSNQLVITTDSIGPDAQITVGAGTANTDVGLTANTVNGVTAVRAVDDGNGDAVTPLLEFPGQSFTSAATAAVVTGTVSIAGGIPDGETLTFDDGQGEQTVTFDNAINGAAVIAQVNALFGAAAGGKLTASLSTNFLRLTHTDSGEESFIKIVGGTALATVGMTSGTIVRGNPYPPRSGDHVYIDGVFYAAITQVAPGGTVTRLKIDRQVPISTHLGLSFHIQAKNLTAGNVGRPSPDLVMDAEGNAHVKLELLRNTRGEAEASVRAQVYLQYRAIRQDVSPLSKNPGLLRFNSTATLEDSLAPLSADNPLALALFFALLNAPTTQVTGLGVDAANDASPYGTTEAYARAAQFLEGYEVYAVAPMTHEAAVGQIFNTHVSVMSDPSNKGERIALFNPQTPTNKLDTLVASGTRGSTTPTLSTFDTGVANLGALLLGNGVSPVGPVGVSSGVFLDIGDGKRYSISLVSGSVVTLKTSGFLPGENDDGYYATTAFPTQIIEDPFAVRIRGAALELPDGRPDKDGIALTMQTLGQSYLNRRFWMTFPDRVAATLNGIEQVLPGFYANAGVAGMIGRLPPQQSFTNIPMTGYTRVLGSNDTFSSRQLDVMAGGGTYIFVQDDPGTPIISRMALTTDLTSIETRTDSITKVVDFTAKFCRRGIRAFIGRFNITSSFLDSLGYVIQGLGDFLVGSGILVGFFLNNIIQDESAPDTVLIDVTLDVPYPCNYIRLTLVI